VVKKIRNMSTPNGLPTQLAKHLRAVISGGNWSDSNYQDQLKEVDWEMATTKVEGVNTILQLVYHVSYYLPYVAKVLEGGTLDAKDKYSWDTPDIQSEQAWQELLKQFWRDAEQLAQAIEQLADEQLQADFADPKYGDCMGNILGIIEHLHYHLGQIVVLKKRLASR
jgi:hypothetical protein